MPRHVVERTLRDGLEIPLTDEGAAACLAVVRRHGNPGVTWVHSYVVDRVVRVSELNPYFYRWAGTPHCSAIARPVISKTSVRT